MTLFFDGCSKGNPGPSGCGAIIKYDLSEPLNKTHSEYIDYIGITTNNVAEYKGLILGLKYCKTITDLKFLTIKGDSMLIINQMTGKYKVKSPHLMTLYNEATKLILDLKNMKTDIMFLYIPREENKEADHLANLGLKSYELNIFEKPKIAVDE